MNSIYKSLERSSVSGLDPHQIQILCEYLQGHYTDSSVCEASRVLLQLVIFAKGDSVTKSIQELYVDVITNSAVEVDEFVSLGECIVKLLELYRSFGAESLKGCSLELPFLDLECSPKKYSLPIRSFKALMDILTFWDSVVAQFYQDRTAPLTASSTISTISNRIVSVLVDLTRMLPEFDATATMVITLSKAIQAVLVHSSLAGVKFSASSSLNTATSHFACEILDGLINWCSHALTCSERLIAKSRQKEAMPVSPKPTAVSSWMYLQMARALHHIVTIAHIVSQMAAEDLSIAADVEVLLKNVGSVLQQHSIVLERTTEGNLLDLLLVQTSPAAATDTSHTAFSYSAEGMIRLIMAQMLRIAAALSPTQSVSASATLPLLSLNLQNNCADLTLLYENAALLAQQLRTHRELSIELAQCWGATLEAPTTTALTLGKNTSFQPALSVREGAHFTPVSPLLTTTATKNVDPWTLCSEAGTCSAEAKEAVMRTVLSGNDNMLVRELTESVLQTDTMAMQAEPLVVLNKVRSVNYILGYVSFI